MQKNIKEVNHFRLLDKTVEINEKWTGLNTSSLKIIENILNYKAQETAVSNVQTRLKHASPNDTDATFFKSTMDLFPNESPLTKLVYKIIQSINRLIRNLDSLLDEDYPALLKAFQVQRKDCLVKISSKDTNTKTSSFINIVQVAEWVDKRYPELEKDLETKKLLMKDFLNQLLTIKSPEETVILNEWNKTLDYKMEPVYRELLLKREYYRS